MTTLNWIDENVINGNKTPAVIKRPDVSALPQPLLDALSLPPRCAGHLEKMAAPSWFGSQWQRRYFELRGEFIFYYSEHAGVLLGAIDLSQFETAKVTTGQLVLVSTEEEVRLRTTSVQGATNASIRKWLTEVSRVMDDAKEDETNSSLLSSSEPQIGQKRDGTDSGSGALSSRLALSKIRGQAASPDSVSSSVSTTPNEKLLSNSLGPPSPPPPTSDQKDLVVLTDVFDESASHDPSASSMENPLLKVSSKPSSGDFSVEESDVELGATSPSAGPTLHSNEAVTTTEGVNGAANDDSLPKGFVKLLVKAGLQSKDGSRKVTWAMRRIRCIMFGYFFLAASSIMVTYVFESDGCVTTLSFDPTGRKPPCLFQASLVLPVLSFSFSSLVAYIWLLKYGDARIIIRTHRERMRDKFSKFTLNCQRYLYFYVALSALVFLLPNFSGFDMIWVLILIFPIYLLLAWFLMSFALPTILVTLMYYAASRRLRLMLKDFLKLLKKRPFDYNVVSNAYIELVTEWDMTQEQLGAVVSIVLMGSILSAIGNFVFFIYIGNDFSVQNESNVIQTNLLGLVVVLPLIGVNLCTMIGANQRADSVYEACTALIAHSSECIETTKNEVDGNLSEKPELGASHDDMSDASVHGLSALKLATLVDERPCELRLLGQKITTEDLLGYAAFLIALQIINVLGVGSILFGDS